MLHRLVPVFPVVSRCEMVWSVLATNDCLVAPYPRLTYLLSPSLFDCTPCCALQVVIIDERFELMLIFWSTMAVFQANFGATIKKSLTDQIDQIRKYARAALCERQRFLMDVCAACLRSDLLGAEKKYNAALDGCIEVHRKGEAMVDVRTHRVPKCWTYGSVCCACAQRPSLPRACHSG
jgi:hypothetical protein